MESNLIISTKNQRTQFKRNIPPSLNIIECIREFELSQTFPSMAKHKKLLDKSITVQKINLPITMSQNNELSNDTKLTNKLQKLKLKSPDGRHLGEFDVQILPQDNNIANIKNTSITLPNNTSLNTNDIKKNVNTDCAKSNMAIMKISPNVGKNNLLSSSNYQSNHGVNIPTTPSMVNINKNQHQLPIVSDNNKNKKMYVIQSGNNWQVVKFGDKMKHNVCTMSTPVIEESSCKIKTSPTQIDSKNKDHIQTHTIKNSSVFKTVQNSPSTIIKHTHTENIQGNQLMMNKRHGINKVRMPGTKRSSNVPLVRSMVKKKKIVNVMNGDTNIINIKNLDENAHCNSSNDHINEISNDNENAGKSVAKSRQFYPLRNSHGTVNLIRRGKKDLNIVSKLSNIKNVSVSNDIPVISTTNSSQSTISIDSLNNVDKKSSDDMSNKLSIVGHALSMITDDELRIKALQALADCGIGIERLVPSKPKLDQMVIKETQTQTNVFGLLDSNDFIRVTGDTDNLMRLQEIEKHVIFDDMKITNKPRRQIQRFVNELDEILNQQWVNKAKVEQVKQILKINPLAEKACNLMIHDFRHAKKYNNNGLLNIHRAILSDQARTVKRQLMVLRSCKQSIDLPTLNGETGLELAIKSSVSPEIINLLLKSGANPTSHKTAHDSALIIAAKESSHFLPQLIKYVSTCNDLNHFDSGGYTALHYCVRNNNLDGISALIQGNVDLNVRDLKSGRTPLFHALENDYIEAARILLANGAKPNIPNFSGQNVFTLFDEEKHYTLKDAFNKSVK